MTEEEFCALYDAHARTLWAYVVRATRSSAAADDIVQETFARVWTAKGFDRAETEHRRRYLYIVATNLMKREYKRRGNEAPWDESMSPPVTESPDDALAVERALGVLSQVERQTLWLVYVEQHSHREIAQMLGYREGSLRQVAVRAKRRFLEAWKGIQVKRGVHD